MMTFSNRIANVGRILALPALIGLTACDNPVDDDHDEHPVGLVILNAEGDVIVNTESPSDVLQQLSVAVDATETFTVRALSEDGDQITIDGEEFSIVVGVTAAASIAAVAQQGDDQITVTGQQAGSAQLDFRLDHELHEEFSRDVTLVITS